MQLLLDRLISEYLGTINVGSGGEEEDEDVVDEDEPPWKKLKRVDQKRQRLLEGFVDEVGPINDPLEPDQVTVKISNVNCQNTQVLCKPSEVSSTQCLECSNFFVRCNDVSNQPVIDLVSGAKLGGVHPDDTGVCVTDPESVGVGNTHTTNLVAGVLKMADDYLLLKNTLCVDTKVADKDYAALDGDPEAIRKASCDVLKLCGGNGRPIYKGTVIYTADDITVSVSDLLREGSCACIDGYKPVKGSDGYPTCVPESFNFDCPVKIMTGDDPNLDYLCVCNPATQINLKWLAEEVDNNFKADVSNEFLEVATKFYTDVTEKRDMCVPKPGVDDRTSAFGYSAIQHQVFDKDVDKDTYQLLCTALGGHLATGVILKKSGFTGDKASLKYDGIDEDTGALAGRGGVVPCLGTGSVPAYLPETVVLNSNNFLEHPTRNDNPNASLKVVPPSSSGIPGVGKSYEQAVGLVSSSGRVYTDSVYNNGTVVYQKAEDNVTKPLYVKPADLNDMETNNPLSDFMFLTDEGDVAGAFLVPFMQDPLNTDFGTKDGSSAKDIVDVDDYQKAESPYHIDRRWVNSLDLFKMGCQRHVGRSFGYYPVERVFRYTTAKSFSVNELGFSSNLSSMFPELVSNNKQFADPSLSKPIVGKSAVGGLLMQPIKPGGGTSTSWHGGEWVKEVLAANHPKKTDYYQTDDCNLFTTPKSVDTGYVYPRTPVRPYSTVTNATGQFTGMPLLNHPNSNPNGVDPTYMVKQESFRFVDTQVLGSENIQWSEGDERFTYFALPPDIPNTLPELARFSLRSYPLASDPTELAAINNNIPQTFDTRASASCPQRYAIEQFPEDQQICLPDVVRVPRLIGPANWQKTSSNMLEHVFQNMTRSTAYYGLSMFAYTPPISIFTQHASQMLTQNRCIPCYKYIDNGDAFAGASINRVFPIVIPSGHMANMTKDFPNYARSKIVDWNNLNEGAYHIKPLPNCMKSFVDMEEKSKKSFLLMGMACPQTDGSFQDFCGYATRCKASEAPDNKSIATASFAPSYKPYIFQKNVPSLSPRIFAMYMRGLLNDARIETPASLLSGLTDPWHKIPIACNFMNALRSNDNFMTYFSGRPLIEPHATYTDSEGGFDSEWDKATDDTDYLLNFPNIFDIDKLTELYESITTVSPSTVSSCTVNAPYEGAGDICMSFGAPMLFNPAANDWLLSKGPAEKRPYRFIHNYKVMTPSQNTFESGKPKAAVMLARPFETYKCAEIKVLPTCSSTSGSSVEKGAMYNGFCRKLDIEALNFYSAQHQDPITTRHDGVSETEMKNHGGFGAHFGPYPFFYVPARGEVGDADAHVTSSNTNINLMPLTRQMTPQVQALEVLYGANTKNDGKFSTITYEERFGTMSRQRRKKLDEQATLKKEIELRKAGVRSKVINNRSSIAQGRIKGAASVGSSTVYEIA